MKKQYVTLNLENINRVPVLQHNVSYSKSVWRYWRQLSRLQKNLIVTLIFITFFFIFYSIIFNSQRTEKNVEEPIVFNVEQNQVSPVNIDKYNEISEIDLNNIVEKKLAAMNKEQIKKKQRTKKIISLYWSKNNVDTLTARQKAVINAAKHAWTGYKKYAWGHDHLRPISLTYHDWFHLGLTIIDSLDTLYMMNLTSEFNDAKIWIENKFSFDHYSDDVNLFEVTIRILGGLLSAYHFSHDGLFLEKAADLGERLLPCFTKSPSPIPFSDINLASRIAHVPKWSPDSSTSEVTTLQLEFRDLSRCTKDSKFEEVAFNVTKHVHNLKKPYGLVPIFINPNTGQFNSDSEIKIGARGDSYYEYLLKQWLQTGKTIDFLKDDYIEAIKGITEKLVKVTPNKHFVFIGELKARSHLFSPKMDHLTCYLPGTLALGVYNGMPEEHMRLAEQLLETCYHMYADQPTFLAPEISYFNYEEKSVGPDMYVQQRDTHNLLRPEFIESLWVMYQITGDVTYQDWGWRVFQAIERYSKVANGYTSIANVLDPNNTKPKDLMESFFMSETLKYLFLLFSSNRHFLNLEKYVMNSEGHPLPIYNS
ncbi:hypothetical protein PGB90_000644 [Kerria lacca]